MDEYLTWRAQAMEWIEAEADAANQTADDAVATALAAFAHHLAIPDPPWAATQAARLALVIALDGYTLRLLRTNQIGLVELAAYQKWRTAERANLHALLAEIDVEALFQRKASAWAGLRLGQQKRQRGGSTTGSQAQRQAGGTPLRCKACASALRKQLDSGLIEPA